MSDVSQTYVYLGTIWEDQDKREPNRRATVVALDATHATCLAKGKNGSRMVHIRLDRFGKAWKRCGFDSNVAPGLRGADNEVKA